MTYVILALEVYSDINIFTQLPICLWKSSGKLSCYPNFIKYHLKVISIFYKGFQLSKS